MSKSETTLWIKVSDRLPTDTVGDQVKVIFGSPEWACPIVGLYTRDQDRNDEWAAYDQLKDRYIIWTVRDPEYWMLMPDLPTKGSVTDD